LSWAPVLRAYTRHLEINQRSEPLSSDEIAYLSAIEVLRRFRAGEFTPREYLEVLLDRQERIGGRVNAFGELYLDDARIEADAATEVYRSRASDARPLEGLPVAIKDETPVRGKITTVGSLLHESEPETTDAVVVERLREAGAIILGRTTTPEFCAAPWTHSKVWGTTRNPWNLAYGPGGSSGGAGAVLAAGLAPLADGSDIAGSIRIPASFCGLVGFKPPYGRVPGIPLYNLDTYNHQGPLARTVADCALFEDVISGPDSRDPAALPTRVTTSDVQPSVVGMKIAVSLDLGGFDCDSEVRAAVQEAASRFRDLGATVEEVQVGWTMDQIQTAARAHYNAIFGAEIREHAQEHPDELTPYIHELVRVLGQTDCTYVEGLAIEGQVHAAVREVFNEYDLLIGPVLATTGFVAGEDYVDTKLVINGSPLEHWLDALPTMVFNIASRHPVLVVPVTCASNGIPIGVQIVGPLFDDRAVFAAGAAFEAQDPWYVKDGRRPDLDAEVC
jgi:Asp-tRNA(Asn)/Glu-tRNA(Gln) amidotransferase A subunit family amidase